MTKQVLICRGRSPLSKRALCLNLRSREKTPRTWHRETGQSLGGYLGTSTELYHLDSLLMRFRPPWCLPLTSLALFLLDQDRREEIIDMFSFDESGYSTTRRFIEALWIICLLMRRLVRCA